MDKRTEAQIGVDMATPLLCGQTIKNILADDPDRCVKCEKAEACERAFLGYKDKQVRGQVCVRCGAIIRDYKDRKYCSHECACEGSKKNLRFAPEDKGLPYYKLAKKYDVSQSVVYKYYVMQFGRKNDARI